jgi:hypothetical protein
MLLDERPCPSTRLMAGYFQLPSDVSFSSKTHVSKGRYVLAVYVAWPPTAGAGGNYGRTAVKVSGD